MAFPDTLLAAASTWFSNVLVDAARIQANITDNLNALATRVTGIGQGFIGEASSSSNVTLSTTNAFAGLATVTFPLATQRRVKISTFALFSPAGAVAATYHIKSGYNSGSSAAIGSVTTPGADFSVSDEGAATRNKSGHSECTALLAAGTWTAYASVQRLSGGAATDVASTFYTLVEDIGSV